MATDITFELIVGGFVLALIPTLLVLGFFVVLYGLFFAAFTGIPTLILGSVLSQLGTGPVLAYVLAFVVLGIPCGAVFYSWFFRFQYSYGVR